MTLSGGVITGIVIGSIIGVPVFVFLLLLCIRVCIRGPTKGSDNPRRLDGKIVVITGANSGIGKATATDLARRGPAKIVICCRDVSKGEEAAEEIRLKSGTSSVILVQQLDLASLKSVRQCAQALHHKLTKIDILINNAGICQCPQWKTEDGFDMQMGTNHLGHFLLTQMLLPLMKDAATENGHARIVIVASMAEMVARNGISFDDINFDKSYSPLQAYGQSKLANILHAKELARRLDNSGISVYALHPGTVATDVFRHLKIPGWLKPIFNSLVKFVFKTPHHGAQTSIFCAVDEKIESHSGNYYYDCKVQTPSRNARNLEAAQKLWAISEELVMKE